MIYYLINLNHKIHILKLLNFFFFFFFFCYYYDIFDCLLLMIIMAFNFNNFDIMNNNIFIFDPHLKNIENK